ncbi:hypothetical protein [Lysobacter sp. D1-1-M9]|uniref:hypothetical protein n=1 Tax=Novilysobacter longmucuonensis TaxID=3098603 RepID=UPI002FCBC35F
MAVALAVAAGCTRSSEEQPGARPSGLLLDPQMNEISGLAASRRHRDVLWMHDDGGNPERLFAVSDKGRRLATFGVEGIVKTDWEDIAAFELDGRDYLLIADTGDNGGLRHTLQLHVIEEPASLQNARLQPVWSIAFRWPDGARDCEAVAVDVARNQVLLVSKKRQPPQLFAVALRPAGTGLQTAVQLGELAGVPQMSEPALQQAPASGRYDSQVTAADISPDGRTLAVMTYRYLLLYPRADREDWGTAVSRAPQLSELPWLPQAEALGWSADGDALYATGEFVPAPLYRITP